MQGFSREVVTSLASLNKKRGRNQASGKGRSGWRETCQWWQRGRIDPDTEGRQGSRPRGRPGNLEEVWSKRPLCSLKIRELTIPSLSPPLPSHPEKWWEVTPRLFLAQGCHAQDPKCLTGAGPWPKGSQPTGWRSTSNLAWLGKLHPNRDSGNQANQTLSGIQPQSAS